MHTSDHERSPGVIGRPLRRLGVLSLRLGGLRRRGWAEADRAGFFLPALEALTEECRLPAELPAELLAVAGRWPGRLVARSVAPE